MPAGVVVPLHLGPGREAEAPPRRAHLVLGEEARDVVRALRGIDEEGRSSAEPSARVPRARAPDHLVPAAPCEVMLGVDVERVARLAVVRLLARGAVVVGLHADAGAGGELPPPA